MDRSGSCRLALRRGLSALVMMLLIVPALTRGDEPAPVRAGEKEGVLVLVSGRVVSGRISQASGGYMVAQPNGEMLVPSEYVRFQADDVQDAYTRQRDELEAGDTDGRLALANWCITWQLHAEARAELLSIIRLDPQHAQARRLLVRVDELLRPEDSQRVRIENEITAGSQPQQPDVESLGGLSRETAQTFTTRIQPILLNNCGNAACHGSAAPNDFRLERVHYGRAGSRLSSERNLAAVLRRVDFGSPEQSLLVREPRGPHGQSVGTIFAGPRGIDQWETLSDWVRQVAREQRGKRSSLGQASRPGDRPTAIAQARSDEPDRGGSKLVEPAGFESRLRPESDGELLDRVRHEEQADPFDPAEFNRLYGRKPTRR